MNQFYPGELVHGGISSKVRSSSTSSSKVRSELHRLLVIFIISISLTAVMGDSMSAPETEIQQDEERVNACAFQQRHQMFCQCDRTDDAPLESEDLKCWSSGTAEDQDELWMAIGNLKHVTHLELNNRPPRAQKTFPPQYIFHELKSLQYFSMKMSQFDSLSSDAFSNSSTINEIILNDNLISKLGPRAFANLNNLNKLNVDDNSIIEINRGVFVNLPQLKSLFLNKNRIEIVHDNAFKDLENLEELDLQKNNLSVIARQVFSGLKSLTRLELQNNLIEYLGDHVFADMPLLEELDLHGNQIRSVSPTAFFGLKQLGRLNIKENKIVSLQAPTFSHMGKLYMLDLRSNELETLSESLIQPIYLNLKNVSMQLMIEGNRLMCDCRILWIQKLYKETESNYLKEHLTKIHCDLFYTPEQKEKSFLNHDVAVRYSSNVTVVVAAPPEETTTYAFDSSKKVIELNPHDFKCHEQQENDQQKDSSATYPDSQDESKGDSRGAETTPQKPTGVLFESKKDSEQSHHQSHIDISLQSDESSKGSTSSGGCSSSRIINRTNYYLSSSISFIFYSTTLFYLVIINGNC